MTKRAAGKVQYRYHFVMNARSKHHDGETGLVPHRLDFGATAPFIDATLFGFLLLQDQPPVEQYGRANPDARRAIFALSETIGQVGIRVRDSGAGKKADFRHEDLRLYTAEEIWMFDLAIDALAMLTTGGGLHDGVRMQALDHLKMADEHSRDGHWKRALRHVGDGPEVFRVLRAHVPHRATR